MSSTKLLINGKVVMCMQEGETTSLWTSAKIKLDLCRGTGFYQSHQQVLCLFQSHQQVLCPLFDEIEILIPGDSLSIFQSLDKMWNFNSFCYSNEEKWLLKQFIKHEWMRKGVMSIPLFHKRFKSIHWLDSLFLTCNVQCVSKKSPPFYFLNNSVKN